MNLLVILAHPDPRSLNHAIARTVMDALRAQGHTVVFHDLYAERFDPLLPAAEVSAAAELPESVARHCAELKRAEGLVIVHPNWWGQPPAILKGWVDRVFRPGVAYRFLPGDSGEGVPECLLSLEHAVVFNTANTPPAREQKEFGDPLERIWCDCILRFCGVRHVQRRTFATVADSSPEQRSAWLDEVRRLVQQSFPGESAKDRA